MNHRVMFCFGAAAQRLASMQGTLFDMSKVVVEYSKHGEVRIYDTHCCC
jgi:hypothetical protein